MKKKLRIVFFLSIIALYGSAMGLCSSSLFFENRETSKQTTSLSQQHFFFTSSGSHNQIAENENSGSIYTNAPVITIKNSLSKLSASAKAIEHSFFCTYSQYSFYSHCLLIRLQQTDIIFPFHYFW